MTLAHLRLVALVFLCSLGWVGCLEPVPQHGLYSSYVLPADTRVPRLEDDAAATKRLDANDGLGMSIPLHSAFVAGSEVQYWDFGQLTSIAVKPMYIFRRSADGASDFSRDIGHPDLIDSIPGDTAYTPLRQIYAVYVTDSYRNERMTSIRAIEDAVEIGIALSPSPAKFFVNCDVTLSTVQLLAASDGTTMAPGDAYYRGELVKQFCLGGLVSNVGAIQLKDDGTFTPGRAYLLRRENESQPLDEMLLKQDLNDDGDQIDTNVIFDSNVLDDTYTSIWRSFEVVVPRDYKFGAAMSEADLFDKSSGQLVAKPTVIEFHDTGTYLNRPIRLVRP
jgi:hypothetical protein